MKIPEFKNIEEEIEFWDTHDFSELLESSDAEKIKFVRKEMSDMEKIKEKILSELKKLKQKKIKIRGNEYTLYLIPELYDEDLNIFEGFIFVDGDKVNRKDALYLKNYYNPPVSGYCPRFLILFIDGNLVFKDYRRNELITKPINEVKGRFLDKLIDLIRNFNEAKVISLLLD